jgi:hypothetical protein
VCPQIDTVQLGPQWADSSLFRDDWFGTIKTDRDTNYTIPRGATLGPLEDLMNIGRVHTIKPVAWI